MKWNKLWILIFFPFFLTGCINYTELNELGIIESIGIEKKDDQYLISVNMIDARSENDESDELRKTYEVVGNTITEAMHNLYLKSTKKVYLSHLETLLLSEEVVKTDTSLLLDFFLSNPQSRNTFATIVVKENNPSVLLKKTDQTKDINDMIEINNQEYGITSPITFEDFARMLLEEGKDAILPTIKLENDTLEVDGYAYFKDNKFQSYLSKEESITYNLLKNLNPLLLVTSDCNNQQISAQLENLRSKIQSKQNKINIHITGSLSILENQCGFPNQQILDTFEEQIAQEVRHLLNQQKIWGSDILGMQSLVRQSNYRYFQKNKENLFSFLSFDIDTKFTYQNDATLERNDSNETK